MEVSDSVQKAGNHAASVLRGLDLQRHQTQYCDCVVRQGQDQGQLYPAHKCILAASSPVLASILSSAGALVELHAPCLSDSVLALVLDFIYTGALPYTCSQQQYHSLLTAARYLQMDELQKTLRTEVNPANDTTSSSGAENQSYPDINSTYSTVVTMSASSRKSSFEIEDHYSKETCGSSSKRIMLTPERLIQNHPHPAEMSHLSGKDKEGQKDQFRSAATVKPESWHESTKEELVGTAKNSRSSYSLQKMGRAEKMQRLHSTVQSKPEEKQSNKKKFFNSSHLCHSTSNLQDNTSPSWLTTSSCPTSPHLFCGAVPVIRHSSTANMAEVPSVPSYHQSSEVSFNSNRRADLQSGSSGNDTIAEGIIRIHKSPYGAHNQDYRCNKDQLEALSRDGSDHHGLQESNSSTADLDEHMGSDLSHIRDVSVHQCDLLQDKNRTANFRDILTSATKDCSSLTSGIKDRTGWSFDDVTPTQQKMECSDFHHVSKVNQAEGQCFNYLRAVDPLPAQSSSPGLDCHCEDASEKISPISEPRPAFTMPMDNDMTDPADGIVGQSYLGHLHYQCIPRADTHLSFRDTDRKHPPPSNHDHAEQSGDDDDEEGTFASPGLSPLRCHFAATDKVLLLDISTKPAELLVSYRHQSDLNEKWDAFAENNEEQQHDAANFAGFDKRQIRAKNKFGAENIDEANSRVAEINAAEKKSNGKEHSRPGAEVIHKAGGAESENKTTTLTVRSPPNVPDSVQATVSSSLSICIPSTLSVSKPTNISPRLSAPVHHPFQCSLCERSFSQRGSLNRHVRSHLGVRPFPCPRCPMTFSRQYRVSEHMRVHQRCSLVNEFHKPPASSV